MANRDISIQASLGKTSASGPGPAELPDVQVERREPIDVFGAAKQLEGLRRLGNRGGGRRSGGQGYNPNMINGGLFGGIPKPSSSFSEPSYNPAPAPSFAPPMGSSARNDPMFYSPYAGMDVQFGGSFGGQSQLPAFQPTDFLAEQTRSKLLSTGSTAPRRADYPGGGGGGSF